WMPHTRWTFLICCLAIAGIPPLAGFWSKDAILGGVYHASWPTGPNPGGLELFFANNLGHILYFTLLIAAGCTAFYMFRLYFLAFEGTYRGPALDAKAAHDADESPDAHAAAGNHAAHDAHGHGHGDDHGHGHAPAHESPPEITVVLWILALGAIAIGLFGMPDAIAEHIGLRDYFGEWLSPVLPPLAAGESASQFSIFALIATGVSALGIGLAWVLYADGPAASVRNFVARAPRLYKLVFNKYYVDELYDFLIVRPVRFTAFVLWKAFDAFFID